MSHLSTVPASVTYTTPNDPTEHPDYDAAFEAELNAHYDAVASEVTGEELEAMYREQQARNRTGDCPRCGGSVDSERRCYDCGRLVGENATPAVPAEVRPMVRISMCGGRKPYAAEKSPDGKRWKRVGRFANEADAWRAVGAA